MDQVWLDSPTGRPKGKAMSIKTIWQKSAKKYVGTDISNLKIVDEQYQGRRIARGKYDDVFGKLKHGQAVSCPSAETQKIANALRDWLKRHNKKGVVKCVTYHTPTTGRVWLMEEK